MRDLGPPTREEWSELYRASASATYFHGPEWPAIWEAATGGTWRACATRLELPDGPRVLATWSEGRLARGAIRSVRSSMAGTYGGWIAARAIEPDQIRALVEWFETRGDELVWRLNPHDPALRDLELDAEPDTTRVVDLSSGIDEALKRWSKGAYAAVQQARRSGVQVRLAEGEADWRRYFQIYLGSLERWGDRASSRYDWPLFEALSRASSDVRLWLSCLGNQVIAGAIVLSAPRIAVYWHGAADDEHFSARPVNLLIYEALRAAGEAGIRTFDFNPSGGHPGVVAFKKGFGTVELPAPIVRRAGRRSRLVRAASRLLGRFRAVRPASRG